LGNAWDSLWTPRYYGAAVIGLQNKLFTVTPTNDDIAVPYAVKQQI